MLYYGDRRARVDPAAALRDAAAAWSRTRRGAANERLDAVTDVLVRCGEVAQGLADAAFSDRGEDAPDPAADAALRLCIALARELVAACDVTTGPGDSLQAAFGAIAALPLPTRVEVRTPEGYAHYAVHPAAYVAAARRLPAGCWNVIGIRSIGTSLAATVAAALGTDACVTVRPVGHPHARRVALSAPLRARLFEVPDASYAVVDEGPGLSGSSFAAVVRELNAAGVPAARIHLLPSHPGEPGPAAGEDTLARWRATARHVVTFEELALGPEPEFTRWFDGALPLGGTPRVEDVSAGAWRRTAFADERAWPAVFDQQERRKLVITAEGTRLLAEYVGLGEVGAHRVARARILAQAGWGPPVIAVRRGFMLRRWLDATPLERASVAIPEARRALLDALPRYLALRAGMDAPEDAGATGDELAQMLEVNAVEELGEGARSDARHLFEAAASRDRGRRVAVDGKLEPWEWLQVASDGSLRKADGVQHADGHDLVGAQPISWDVAGAVVELDLSAAEADALATTLQRETGASLAPGELAFMTAAYAAFRVARWTFAAASAGAPRERDRIERERARYRAALARALSAARR